MGYFSDSGASGILSGMLPRPHDAVRIEVGAAGSDRLYVRYRGTRAALIAAGAIDCLMASGPESSGRDLLLRPFTYERLADGTVSVTRTFASIKKAADLPGIAGSSALNVDAATHRKPYLRLVQPQKNIP